MRREGGSPPPPKTHLLYTEMAYQPMIEPDYLRANGGVHVSGGGIELFVRSPSALRHPPEQVVGSVGKQVRDAGRSRRC
jgi:hypothetical protein